jgi:ribulose-phosphate 3-epimerase
MATIIPAILPTSRRDFDSKAAALRGLVDIVQIDAVDGKFVSPAAWPYLQKDDPFFAHIADGEMLPYVGEIRYEIDLMVADPETSIGTWLSAGVDRVVLHAESTNYLAKVIKEIQVRYGHAKDFAPDLLSLGIALNIGSELSLIEPFLHDFDYIQFMGIRTIGAQGQPFDQEVLRKISLFKKKYPDMPVQVDGGVSLLTAPALLTAGVDRLIIGSAIWNAPNLHEQLVKFNDLIQEYGRKS